MRLSIQNDPDRIPNLHAVSINRRFETRQRITSHPSIHPRSNIRSTDKLEIVSQRVSVESRSSRREPRNPQQ